MGFSINIPKELTDSEKELKNKFAQLRKLKKQLVALKASQSRQEEEEARSLKRKKSTSAEAASAATEQAKKLLKSGAIKVDSSAKSSSFKRARIDRPIGSQLSKDSDKPTISSYKPYSVSDNPTPDTPIMPNRPSYKDSFVPASATISHRDSMSYPRRGPRIFVRGDGLTEVLLREIFSQAGNIQEANMEHNKPSGFVTFDTVESADEAVSRFNKTHVKGVKLEVEIARRQRGANHRRSTNETPGNPPPARAPSLVDHRDMVNYEDNNMFS